MSVTAHAVSARRNYWRPLARRKRQGSNLVGPGGRIKLRAKGCKPRPIPMCSCRRRMAVQERPYCNLTPWRGTTPRARSQPGHLPARLRQVVRCLPGFENAHLLPVDDLIRLISGQGGPNPPSAQMYAVEGRLRLRGVRTPLHRTDLLDYLGQLLCDIFIAPNPVRNEIKTISLTGDFQSAG
jgi:hypothetical protein